ncbi:hypothetical protein [Halorussus halophilus]|uniref:hypothetical protein n=1 Tax=Halorussus halophilus TaxID=2650975 RepID=UPI00130134BD|nr:hypothetical protein [Halorussus halophilus]
MSSTYGRRSRPLGVTIICLVGFLSAFFSLFKLLGVMGTGGPAAVFGLVGLVLLVGKVIVLFGLWTLQKWGYTWSVLLYSLSALLNLVTFSVFGLVIDVLLVVYLMSKADHFR